MTKHPDSTLWNLFSAVMACLTLVVGCAGPTMELTTTNTPTSAAATATPAMASATTTAAPPTETPTPTPIPVTFEIINDAGNPAQDVDYQQLLAACLQITETVAFAAYHVGDVASLVLLAGAPRDKVTGATIQPLTRLLVAENELLPLCCPELLALTAANGAKNVLLAKTDGKELAISGLIPYTNGEHYAIIQQDDGSVVLKNYLDKDSPDAPEYLLEIDPDNPERLVTYIDNSPIYIPTNWQEPIALDEVGDLFINPFEALKAEYVIGNNVEFAQLPEYIQLPNGWQIFEFQGTLTNRNTMDIFSNGSVAFGPNGEVLVANNNIDWSQVTDPGIGYAMSLKTDENQNPIADPFNNNSFTLIATFLGDSEEPALVWHPEGGEDGNGAWVEEEKEYATAAEALLAGTKEIYNKGSISFRIVESNWDKYEELINFAPPDTLQLPEGVDQNADAEIINNFISRKFDENGGIIAAINPITGEVVEVQAKDVEIIVISDIGGAILGVGEEAPYYLKLNKNKNVTQLYLPGNMPSNGVIGEQFGIYYFPATETQKARVVVYLVTNYHMYDNRDERRRMTNFAGSLLIPIALLSVPPEEMKEKVLDVPEGASRRKNDTLVISQSYELMGALQELTQTTQIWQLANSH